MKHLALILLLMISIFGFCQEHEFKTEIEAENVFDLSIIQIYPDSFPLISVVFQANNEFGKPLWTIDKSEINVSENDDYCEVLRLKNISENKPLNIGIVFDHSGSMIDNPSQMPEGMESLQSTYLNNWAMPKGYVMAIECEKKGVLNFLNETENSEDSILFVGFSGSVDKIYPLTNDFKAIKSFVKKVEPGGSTAFFDALYISIDSLSNHKSKGVIVALTDGQDNSSNYSFSEVIEYANEKDISIYIIGLGEVNEFILEKIAKRTNGFYYHTNEPEKLEEIYLNIKEQIKSIYQVDYISNSEDYLNVNRRISFHFVNDTLEFSFNSDYYSLPDETIEYLKEKEETRLTDLRNKIILGAFGILLLGVSGFALVQKLKKKNLVITKAYPNPFDNEVSIDFLSTVGNGSLTLTITSMSGKIVHTRQLNDGLNAAVLSLGHLDQGTYLLQLSSLESFSNSVKVVKQ